MSSGDAGGGVEQPVAQGLGFGPVQLGLVGEQHRLGEREQVGGDQRQLDADGVDVLVPGGQVAQAGVLTGADAFLDAGVRPMAGFQQRGLPTAGVGGEGLVAEAVTDLARRPASRRGVAARGAR